MDVRVWSVVQDRLIEVRVEPPGDDPGIRIVGLPEDRARTAADRLRAALLNSGLLREARTVTIRLEPAVRSGTTSDLDLPLALAALAAEGAIGSGLRWILATGRLGLDGRVFSRDHAERLTLADVVDPFVVPGRYDTNVCSSGTRHERAPVGHRDDALRDPGGPA